MTTKRTFTDLIADADALPVAGWAAAGLVVTQLREQALRVEFFDVGAVAYFLRKVLWTVPGFTVAGYAAPLARMHEHITEHGCSSATRAPLPHRSPEALCRTNIDVIPYRFF